MPTIADLLVAVRATLDEKQFKPDGTARDSGTMSHSNLDLARYAQRVLSTAQQTMPAAFFSNPGYDPYEWPLGLINGRERAATNQDLTRFLASTFPLPSRHINPLAEKICVLAQTEGNEQANPQQARILNEAARAAEEG